MANLTFPDPAKTLTCTVLVQSSEGAPSVTVRLGSDYVVSYGSDPSAPDALTAEQLAAWEAFRDLMLASAKERLIAQAIDNNNTLTFVDP